MSGNRYFSEGYSKLTFKRVEEPAELGTPVDQEALRKVIADAEKANLPLSLLTELRSQLRADGQPVQKEVLTDEEVSLLKSKIKALGLDYYGVLVNKEHGIYFDMVQEGNLYSAEGDLMDLFDTVADTVLFSGVVEIWGNSIDEYSQYEISDSVVINEKSAEIKWV